MTLLEYDAFLTELTKMFQQSKTKRAVTITMKRYDGRTKPIPRKSKTVKVPQPTEFFCHINAKSASKKISAVIHAKDMNKFQMAYLAVLKGNMEAMKRRSDVKEKKVKTKTKATQ